jgi:hypothetical protein
MPNPKEANAFEVEPVYTQTTSKIGISTASLAPKLDDRKLPYIGQLTIVELRKLFS